MINRRGFWAVLAGLIATCLGRARGCNCDTMPEMITVAIRPVVPGECRCWECEATYTITESH